jgi:hypothetical protein
MYAHTSQPGLVLITPPRLAAVQTRQGTTYLARTREFRGFVVQRRYRGLGSPYRWRYSPDPGEWGGQIWQKYEWLVPTWQPVLHPPAIAAAGLDYAQVAAWVETHGAAALTHSTYAPLCLRWGDNGPDCFVQDLATPEALHPPVVCFFAQTHPATGEALFYLETALPEGPLLTALHETAGLRRSSRPAGDYQSGYVTPQLAAAQQVVAAHGYGWAWAQRYGVYEVRVCSSYAGELTQEACWQFATPEEARAWFGQLRSEAPPSPSTRSRISWATLQTQERLRDEVRPGEETHQKWVATNWAQTPPALSARQVAAVRARGVRAEDLGYGEQPAAERVPSLAALLAQQSLPGAEVAARLHLSWPGLRQRLSEAAPWTEVELARVAALTGWSVADLRTLYPFR